jgi:GntR family transcriptional regulator/MocR family aminotransferase
VPEGWASSLDLHLALDGGTGRRAAIETGLRDAIRDGRLTAGDRLPSTRALAADLGVARGTVSEAYDQLVAEGWLTARQGAATTVAALAPGATPPLADPGDQPAPRHDFRPGGPDLSAFPRAAWVGALRRVLRSMPDADLGYGEPFGHPSARATLAAYVGRVRGVTVDPTHLLVCSGWSQALDLLTKVLRARGVRAVGMEDPCIAHYRATAQAAGMRVVPLPVDEAGADIDGLGAAGAAVLTPAHQYPSGVTLAPDRRAAAVAWARDRDGLIVEDDYDGELRYDRQPVGALQALDPARVVYVGTAAKSLAPGLRLGWVAVPDDLVPELREAKHLADRQTPVLDQLTLAELIGSGAYDRHLRRSRLRYRRRRDLLLAALAERVPHLVPTGIAAGLHVVVALPRSEGEVMAGLAERSVAVTPMGPSRHRPGSGSPAIVVGYGTPPEHGYRASVEALVDGLAAVTGN